tara:strand:- start:79 stop:360 length:282 start_codon:yes stop_codon:yes gene_type:complete
MKILIIYFLSNFILTFVDVLGGQQNALHYKAYQSSISGIIIRLFIKTIEDLIRGAHYLFFTPFKGKGLGYFFGLILSLGTSYLIVKIFQIMFS